MKDILKKSLLTAFIGICSLIPLTQPALADGYIYDEEKIYLLFPDRIGAGDSKQEPKDPYTIYNMVFARISGNLNYPLIQGRSGWSADTSEFVNGVWEITEAYHAMDSSFDYTPQQLKGAIIKQHGSEMYDLLEENNAIFSYEYYNNIPKQYLKNNKYNSDLVGMTQGKYIIYHSELLEKNAPKYEGSRAFRYNNYDFYVSSYVYIPWKDEMNPKDIPNEGHIYWELERTDKNEPSELTFDFVMNVDKDVHEAWREEKYEVNYGGKVIESAGPISHTTNALELKDSALVYRYSYEYTNKQIGLQCSGPVDDQKCTWNSNPDWRAEQLYEIEGFLPIEHDQFGSHGPTDFNTNLTLSAEVGRKHTYVNLDFNEKVYYEKITRKDSGSSLIIPDDYKLKTQSYTDLSPGDWYYTIELPSKSHKNPFNPLLESGINGYMVPIEIDQSIKHKY